MSKSKIRLRSNRLKLLLAAVSIVWMRRLFYCFVLLALSIAVWGYSAGPVRAELNQVLYADVDGHWAEMPIVEAVSSGMASGYEDGTFKPDQAVSGAELASMLVHGLQIPLVAVHTEPGETEPGIELYYEALEEAGIWVEGDREAAAEASAQGLPRLQLLQLAVKALEPQTAVEEADEIKDKAMAAGLLDFNEAQAEQAYASLTSEATRAEAVIVLQRLQVLLGLK